MAEVNESVVENVSNASNATGRDAATAEGVAITYSSLFLMALLPLFFGSLRSVGYHAGLKVQRCRGQRTVTLLALLYISPQTRGEEAGDRIAMRDAAMFPVYASAGLFGLYLFFKVCACGGGIGRKSSVLFFSVPSQRICEHDSQCPVPWSGDQCSDKGHEVSP